MATPNRDAMKPEPKARIQFAIEPALNELAPAAARIRDFLSGHGVDNTAIFAIETAIEELATNAIKYAFRSTEAGKIIIEACATATRAELLIEDNGAAFDPTEVPDPQVNSFPGGYANWRLGNSLGTRTNGWI
jgi:anti-sigma regulatory factor (Ser/Thr protein kinase)